MTIALFQLTNISDITANQNGSLEVVAVKINLS
jgi:hypothetical protein